MFDKLAISFQACISVPITLICFNTAINKGDTRVTAGFDCRDCRDARRVSRQFELRHHDVV